jgi:hypothetical protein
MNWNEVIDGLLLIASWMLVSSVALIIIVWTIRRFFPNLPEEKYTYVLKTKNGKRTTVVLRPGLTEAEQEKIMNEGYQRLGIPPESMQVRQ